MKSVWSAVRLPPAVAMAPPAPPQYRRTLLSRLIQLPRISQLSLMVLRQIIRWPAKAALTMLGIIIGVAAVITLVSVGRGVENVVGADQRTGVRHGGLAAFAVAPGFHDDHGLDAGYGRCRQYCRRRSAGRGRVLGGLFPQSPPQAQCLLNRADRLAALFSSKLVSNSQCH